MGASAAILFTVAQSGNDFFSAQNAAKDATARGALEKELAERNARLVEAQKAQTAKQFGFQEGQIRGDVRQAVSSTRAGLAGQGVDVGVGSAVDLVATLELFGEADVQMLRNNAALAAWGYDTSAADLRFQGRLAELAGKNEAAALKTQSYSTLLTGAANTYGVYKATRKPDVKPVTTDYTQDLKALGRGPERVNAAGNKYRTKGTFHGTGRLPFGSDY